MPIGQWLGSKIPGLPEAMASRHAEKFQAGQGRTRALMAERSALESYVKRLGTAAPPSMQNRIAKLNRVLGKEIGGLAKSEMKAGVWAARSGLSPEALGIVPKKGILASKAGKIGAAALGVGALAGALPSLLGRKKKRRGSVVIVGGDD